MYFDICDGQPIALFYRHPSKQAFNFENPSVVLMPGCLGSGR